MIWLWRVRPCRKAVVTETPMLETVCLASWCAPPRPLLAAYPACVCSILYGQHVPYSTPGLCRSTARMRRVAQSVLCECVLFPQDGKRARAGDAAGFPADAPATKRPASTSADAAVSPTAAPTAGALGTSASATGAPSGASVVGGAGAASKDGSDSGSGSDSESSSTGGSDSGDDDDDGDGDEGYRAPVEQFFDLPVARLNPYLTCPLCGGYFRDAHTTVECLHTCTPVRVPALL